MDRRKAASEDRVIMWVNRVLWALYAIAALVMFWAIGVGDPGTALAASIAATATAFAAMLPPNHVRIS